MLQTVHSNLKRRLRTHKQQILDPRLRNLYVSHHIAIVQLEKEDGSPSSHFYH